MARPGGGDAQPPETEVYILDGDGSSDADPAELPAHRPEPAVRGRRIGIAIGVAVAFVVGVVVGRTGTGAGSTAGSPPASSSASSSAASSSAASSVSPSAIASSTGRVSASGRTASSRTAASSPVSAAGVTTATAPIVGPGPFLSPGDGSTRSNTPTALLNPAFSAAIGLPPPGGLDVQSMAVVDDRLAVLTSGWFFPVSWGNHGGLSIGSGSDVGLPIGDPTYATWRLLSDGSRLWAISVGGANRVYLVNPKTLRPVHEVNGPPSGSVTDAVALGGDLYLNTDSGVFQVTPSTTDSTQMKVVARGGQAMAADPSRHRLLVLNHDNGWAIHAYAPPTAKVVASAPLSFQALSVAVADGAIWVTGTRSGANPHPVLARLDPRTLTVVTHSPLERSLTSVPEIVATGDHLWIRGEDTGTELWSVDARTGAVAQHWPDLPGMVAARGGHVFVADGTAVGQLALTAH